MGSEMCIRDRSVTGKIVIIIRTVRNQESTCSFKTEQCAAELLMGPKISGRTRPEPETVGILHPEPEINNMNRKARDRDRDV